MGRLASLFRGWKSSKARQADPDANIYAEKIQPLQSEWFDPSFLVGFQFQIRDRGSSRESFIYAIQGLSIILNQLQNRAASDRVDKWLRESVDRDIMNTFSVCRSVTLSFEKLARMVRLLGGLENLSSGDNPSLLILLMDSLKSTFMFDHKVFAMSESAVYGYMAEMISETNSVDEMRRLLELVVWSGNNGRRILIPSPEEPGPTVLEVMRSVPAEMPFEWIPATYAVQR